MLDFFCCEIVANGGGYMYREDLLVTALIVILHGSNGNSASQNILVGLFRSIDDYCLGGAIDTQNWKKPGEWCKFFCVPLSSFRLILRKTLSPC